MKISAEMIGEESFQPRGVVTCHELRAPCKSHACAVIILATWLTEEGGCKMGKLTIKQLIRLDNENSKSPA